MYSLSIDYVFNRIYDVLLWIKYTWFFSILHNDKDAYLDARKNLTWDGLRDRGWFDEYLANKHAAVPEVSTHQSLWQKLFDMFGHKLPDSDGDGIPDVSDSSPYDPYNITSAQLKERYEEDYNFFDHMRDIFGVGPKDTDGDAVPDSYEVAHGMDPENPDSDRDGLADGRELLMGTDPLNNDTDHDGIIDGRDEVPLDGSISSTSPDSDSDGVSDKIENILGTDIHNKEFEGAVVVDTIRKSSGNEGFNAATGVYEDMVKAGIIDPAKVTRSALENAVSIAGMILTTEAVVSEIPKKEEGGGNPGMGGMGGGMGMM